MNQTVHELIILRNEFYYKYHKHLKKINVFSMLLTFALLALYWSTKHSENPPPVYIATTADNKVILSPPIDENHLSLTKQMHNVDPRNDFIRNMPEPRISFTELKKLGDDALVIHWANNAIVKLFDYDYIHYRRAIQEMRPYFNQNAYTKFIEAMHQAKTIDPVRARSAVVIPKLLATPKVINKSIMFGHYVWEVTTQIELTYQSSGYSDLIERFQVNVLIARYPTYIAPFYGLLFVQTNFTQVGA